MAYSSYIFNLPNAWLARLIDILTPAHSTVLPQPYFISLSYQINTCSFLQIIYFIAHCVLHLKFV